MGKIYHADIIKVIWTAYITSQSSLQNKEYYQAKRTFYMKGQSIKKTSRILNVYASNNSLKTHKAKTDRTIRKIHKSIMTVEDFNSPVSVMDSTTMSTNLT